MVTSAQPIAGLRDSPAAALIRRTRLVVVLRRIEPRATLLDLVAELADAGARVFEVTFDGADPAGDLVAIRAFLARRDGPYAVGAGTLRTPAQLETALAAEAQFGVAPIFDPSILDAALEAGLPFVPGAFSPTEIDAAWRARATFVKLFPGSSVGPGFLRELHGPMPQIETIVTGGVDGANATSFLDAGAVAVGIGSALVRASAEERRRLIASIVRGPAA
jgi:2-dehydro-3-deoxyphosphogluconate aldolase/(4S)-4-hydroxy-2-oxoglutarate aldolase